MKEINKEGQASINLIIGISIIMIGVLCSFFLGLGIAFSNSTLSFIGSLILASLGLIVLIIERLLK